MGIVENKWPAKLEIHIVWPFQVYKSLTQGKALGHLLLAFKAHIIQIPVNSYLSLLSFKYPMAQEGDSIFTHNSLVVLLLFKISKSTCYGLEVTFPLTSSCVSILDPQLMVLFWKEITELLGDEVELEQIGCWCWGGV